VKVLDLFSGIGGFSLGLERAGMETIAFCEQDKFCQKVLAKHWPNIPIHDDIRSLDGTQYRGSVDVVCGGFPCQDISSAGSQAGISAARSGLFYDMCRIIRDARPKYAVFENVTNLLNGYGGGWFAEVLSEVSEIGYDAEWHCIPASYIGACHRRDRIWIIAYPSSAASKAGLQKPIFRQSDLQKKPSRVFEVVSERPSASESLLFRKDDGIPVRVYRDRIKALGNAVVPQIPEIIGRAIMSIENETP